MGMSGGELQTPCAMRACWGLTANCVLATGAMRFGESSGSKGAQERERTGRRTPRSNSGSQTEGVKERQPTLSQNTIAFALIN